MPNNLEQLQQRINIFFTDEKLLRTALTHRSYLNESKDREELQHNERLEFLGDAVLEMITTEYLFSSYPHRSEGDLTSFRSALVRTSSLSETALELNLGDHILMSVGEEATGGRTRPYILANTFEALLGAIYLEKGMKIAREFIAAFLLPKLEEIIAKRLDIDPKSKLQELAQEVYNYTPTYSLINESGPDHNKEFIMAVEIVDHEFGRGKGKNKQEAEQQAAATALENWDNLMEKFEPERFI